MQTINKNKFWEWAFTDCVSNSLRGVLAEFIVGKAVQCLDRPRVEWDDYDLKTKDGIKIEVKSSAYVQSWHVKESKPSQINFDIASKKGWSSETRITSKEAKRSANVYVFCVLKEKNHELVDPLDLDQWFFLVLSTKTINESLGNQKSVSLARLEKLGCIRLRFDNLASEIDSVAREYNDYTQ